MDLSNEEIRYIFKFYIKKRKNAGQAANKIVSTDVVSVTEERN